jgi:hypothetical protein
MMDKNPPAVPIIQHPDIRRTLLTMKACVEGMRSIVYYIGNCFDQQKISGSAEEIEKIQGIVDVLIPIAKGYVTDKAFEVCSHGMQVYGGYGFIEEYPQAQLLRDCKITQIYEGTNGIQAMDLLGRKLGMKKGKPLMDMLGEIQGIIAQAKEIDGLLTLAKELEETINKYGEVAMHMGKTAMSAAVMNAFAAAHPFMEVTGDIVMGWMLLWRAVIASKNMGKKKKDDYFYTGQIKSAEFFIDTVLPVTIGKMNSILKTSSAPMEIPEESFNG